MLYIVFAAVAVSCNSVEVDGNPSPDEKESASGMITEIISGRQVATKATISDNTAAFAWTTGDKIAVHVSNSNGSHKYVTTAGAAVDASNTARATFTVEYEAGYSRDYFAIFPSTLVSDAEVAANYGQTGASLDVKLPSSYTLAEVSGTTSPCPMIATNSSTGWDFYQLCSLLRLKVNSIPPSTRRLEINFNGQKVCGVFSVTSESGKYVIATSDNAPLSQSTITITKCGTDVTDPETDVRFNGGNWLDNQVLNIPLPTGSYTKITITAYDALTGGNEILTMTRQFAHDASNEKGVKKTASFSVFPIDKDKTKRVIFAPGNLQATTNDLGRTWTWRFAEHQYDYLGTGTGSANNLITGNGTVSGNGTVDIFFMSVDDYYGITKFYSSGTFNDWGNISTFSYKGVTTTYSPTYWKTLDADGDSDKEGWACAIKFRSDNYRFTLATINTDGTPVNGLIIFPLYYDGSTPPDGVVWRNINIQDYRSATTDRYPAWDVDNPANGHCSTCTTAGWEALEKDGCVFLPAAGYRSDISNGMVEVGVSGGERTRNYKYTRFDNTGYSVTQGATHATSVRLAHEIN